VDSAWFWANLAENQKNAEIMEKVRYNMHILQNI